MRSVAVASLLVSMALIGCGPSGREPAKLEPGTELCASCRMPVSNPALAAQLVSASEEPRFFDDIGCLATYLAEHPTRPAGERAFVADHRTRDWADAGIAVFTRVPGLETPMNSGLVAHATGASREADAAASRGQRMTRDEALSGPLPRGAR